MKINRVSLLQMFQHKADEKDIKKSKVTKTDIPILGTHVIVWIENS